VLFVVAHLSRSHNYETIITTTRLALYDSNKALVPYPTCGHSLNRLIQRSPLPMTRACVLMMQTMLYVGFVNTCRLICQTSASGI